MSCRKEILCGILVAAIFFTSHWKYASFSYQPPFNDNVHSKFSPSNDALLLAFRESFGFFGDIPEDQWIRKKKVSHDRLHVVGGATKGVRGYYQSNWNPDFTCGETEMVHNVGQGGHWICDLWRLNKKGCVVYSIGFGTVASHDFGFERALKERAPLCDIHVFDHVDYSHSVPSEVNFHRIGLKGPYNSIFLNKENQTGVESFQTIPEMAIALGHDKIDFLSLDCQGWEWSILNQLTEADIRQISLMVHGKYNNKLIARKDDRTTEMFQMLHNFGYVIHHKTANLAETAQNIKFSFLKLDPSFREMPS